MWTLVVVDFVRGRGPRQMSQRKGRRWATEEQIKAWGTDTLRTRQDGRHFADDMFKDISKNLSADF